MSNYQNPELAYPEIKPSLLSIFDKIQNQNTKQIGYELFKSLISKSIQSQPQMNYIIQQVSDYISSLQTKEKENGIKLISIIFSPNNFNNKEIYYIYIPPVLSILQSLIKDVNNSLFPSISNIYAEIVQYTMRTDLESSLEKMEQEEKKAYEILQGFCIYNMKYEEKANKICGSLCLTKLVENCPIVLQSNYLKLIWETIIFFIDKKTFNAKYELLNCLISMILGAEGLFKPYANVTLFKVLEFLTDDDWLKRKLALNVIYTIAFYCKEEILPLKSHIISFLKLLKTDKVKEVREVSISILNIFHEKEESKEYEDRLNTHTSLNKSENENKSKNFKKKEVKKQNNIDMNNYNSPEGRQSNSTNITKRSITPNRLLKKKQMNNVDNSNNMNVSSNFGNNNKNIVNRKDDNSFINEKMVIKPDPKHSIFKTNRNKEFFNKAKQQPDILVVDKKVNHYSEMQSNINSNKDEMDIENDNEYNEVNEVNENEEVSHAIDEYKTNKKEENNDYDKEILNNNNNEMNYLDNKEEKDKYNEINNEEELNQHNSIEQPFKNKTAKFNDESILNIKQIEKEKPKQQSPIKSLNNPSNETILINSLLSQMNSLSSKQLLLIDTIESIQKETQTQLDALNNKISTLESTVDSLTNQLTIIKSSPPPQNIKPNQNDINYIFKNALNSDNQSDLLSLISSTSINQLKNVDISLIEDCVIRLIPLLSKGENTKIVISFYKAILPALRLPLRMVIIQNIKDILQYITNSHINGTYHISDEELIDVSIILSSLNNVGNNSFNQNYIC